MAQDVERISLEEKRGISENDTLSVDERLCRQQIGADHAFQFQISGLVGYSGLLLSSAQLAPNKIQDVMGLGNSEVQQNSDVA